MTGKAKRIRRRIGVSSSSRRTRDDAAKYDQRRLQLMLIGGALCLAITSTTSIVSIDAFPLHHSSFSPPPASLASSRTTSTSRKAPWLRRSQMHPHEHYPWGPIQNKWQTQNIRPGRRTFLAAEATPGNGSDGRSDSSTTAASIDATVDTGSIAAMDPDYQRYKKSLHLESDDDDDHDEDFYKDFENFDYAPFLEKETMESSSAAAGSEPESETKPPRSSSEFAVEEKQKTSSESTSGSSGVAEKTESTKSASDLKKESEEEEIRQQEQPQQPPLRPAVTDIPVHMRPLTGFNVVLTHCTADFDSLASAVGLAKLWTTSLPRSNDDEESDFDSSSSGYPTFVVLPRGAHPAVQRFLALHKHLFPIRSLKSLPKDLSKLHRLALVDAQRKDRIGPAEVLLPHADRITVVDHHVDMESDIAGITDYVVDGVGSVSTLIVERLMNQQEKQLVDQLETSSSPITTLTEAEATLLALGIHADTGSLCFDSTTPRDASALAWVMAQGASQVAIAEHAQSSLSPEQQKVLTQALVNTNSTVAHGVTVSTVLLTADGFINGLAAVTQDAMELSSADVFLLGVVYEPKSGRGGKSKKSREPGKHVQSKLLMSGSNTAKPKPKQTEAEATMAFPNKALSPSALYKSALTLAAEEKRLAEERMRSSFDQKDLDGNGFIDRREMTAALVASGIIATEETVLGLMETIDTNKDGVVDFDEFVAFANNVKSSLVANDSNPQKQDRLLPAQEDPNEPSKKDAKASSTPKAPTPSSTLIIIGRAKPGVNMKSVKLGKLLEKYGGGGHPKAASATVRLNDESEAAGIMSDLVDELIETSLQEQSTVGDFMTSPVLSVKSDMSENQVEDLFNRYDVRALPVVNEENEVIGLVTYKEVSAAKQRMFNKEQKRLRQEQQRKEKEAKNKNKEQKPKTEEQQKQNRFIEERRRRGPTVKAWMKQHIKTVEASLTMAEVEAILLENDVGCIPVVRDGTKQLVGMVTRTDLLRQHRYYPSLHYNNKGMSDSIASRKHIVALRKKLKQFDLDE